jgi:hypothetical protein
MAAFVGYTWTYIGPGATVGVYLHGFPTGQFAGIDIQAGTGNRPGFQPAVDFTDHTVAEHVDATLAHTIFVTNKSISNGGPPTPAVNVVVLLEPIS